MYKNDNNSNKRKSAIIIANGKIIDYVKVRNALVTLPDDNTLIISADGGVGNTVSLGFKPEIIIGDMDSIDRKKYGDELSSAEFISARPEKDESDTQLAAEYACGIGIKKIIIAGATGGRLDHTFANMMLLAYPGLKDIDIKIVTEESEIFCIDRSCTIKGSPGKLVSIFSLSPRTTFIRTSGLKYGLKNEVLEMSPVRGLSNVFTEREAVLEFEDGRLLIIKEI